MNIRLLIAKGLKILLNPPALRKCDIDSTSKVCARSELNSVTVDKYSYIGYDCFMLNVGIGAFCSIANRVCIGGAGHPIERVSSSPVFHEGKNVLGVNFQSFPYEPAPKTTIENDVWIGFGAIVKSGVTIHNGAVVGMGSVVTHDIPPYEIWAGNPAHFIRKRFDDETINELERLEWWSLSDSELSQIAPFFDNPALLIAHCSKSDK